MGRTRVSSGARTGPMQHNVITGVRRACGRGAGRAPGTPFRGMTPRRLGKLLLLEAVALALVPALPSCLPLVDLPQHVALHAIWNHIADPAWNLNGRFYVTLATPYAVPQLLAHAAAQVLGPEGGLRFVL